MADTFDLINHAIDANPVEFSKELDQILQQKALEAIDSKRIEIAQSVYAQNQPPEEDFDLDEDDLEFDFDDIDNEEE